MHSKSLLFRYICVYNGHRICVDANLLPNSLLSEILSLKLSTFKFFVHRDAVVAVLLKALTFTSCVRHSFDIYCKKKISPILAM